MSEPIPRGVLEDARVAAVVDRLHALADSQRSAARRSIEADSDDPDVRKQYLSGRFVALEREKAEFCYVLCRAMGAQRIVEAGTSFGVSTIYLATAVRANGGGSVIATEYEPVKVSVARKHFEEAGVSHFIQLREGDIRETLRNIEGAVDFALIDIWTAMARTAIERIAPRLRPGGIIACDNVTAYPNEYAEYLAYVADPANAMRAITLPFAGGLQLALKSGARER